MYLEWICDGADSNSFLAGREWHVNTNFQEIHIKGAVDQKDEKMKKILNGYLPGLVLLISCLFNKSYILFHVQCCILFDAFLLQWLWVTEYTNFSSTCRNLDDFSLLYFSGII